MVRGRQCHTDNAAPPQTRLQALDSALSRMLKLSRSSRRPLLLQKHKPIPIATYIPKFDEGYNPTRRFDPDTERVEQQKLKAFYKKEKKGAVRELRKDNRFLAGEEARRKKEEDVTYQKKVRCQATRFRDPRSHLLY